MSSNTLEGVGKKLRRLRLKCGLTQLEAARSLNITKQTISQWEQGGAQPRIQNLTALATLYGVDPGTFYTGLEDDVGELDKARVRSGRSAMFLPILKMGQIGKVETENNKQRLRATADDIPANAFFVEIDDDANAPRFLPGDLIAIAPEFEARPGQMSLAPAKVKPLFRRYLPVAAETFEGAQLTADNPRWPKLLMRATDKIVGTMIEHISRHHG